MTELCKLMKQHGSDKGDDWHNYTESYSRMLEQYQDSARYVLEVGIGTNNTKFQSHMKPEYTPGGSLRGWRDWFTQAEIYGADIDPDIMIEEDRIKCFTIDQTDAESVLAMWDTFDEDVVFDVIIDDGLHTLEAALSMFENSVHMLADDGLYIIEDIQGYAEQAYRAEFEWMAGETGMEWEYISIPHPTNRTDNNILVLWYGDSDMACQAMEAIKVAA